MIKCLTKYFRTAFVYIVAIVVSFSATTGVLHGVLHAEGLSSEQKKLFSQNILYYDYNYASNDCSAASVTIADGSVYVLGDSYAQGLESAGLESKLTEAGYDKVMINQSVGRSINGGGEKNENALQAAENDADKIKEASKIVIVLGTNPDNYGTGIPKLMKKINGLNEGAVVSWVNVGNAKQSEKTVAAVNKTIQDQSKTFDYSVIDWNAIYKQDAATIAPDKLHPSETGYKKLIEAIVTGLGQPSTGGGADLSNIDSFDWKKEQIEKNKKVIYQFLIGKGLTPAQAAGWMGNIWAESGYYAPKLEGRYEHDYDPLLKNNYNKDYSNVEGLDYNPRRTSSGNGFGLIQWTNTQGDETGRRYWVFETAKKQNKDPLALSFQLEYMWKDMSENYKPVFDKLKKAKTIQEAHDIIIDEYEQPLMEYRIPRKVTGPQEGEKILKKYGGLSGANLAGCDAGTRAGFAGEGGWEMKGPNAMVFYNQTDDKWSGTQYDECTIGEGGCGPTSMAMVVATLNKDSSVTPPVMARYFAGVDNDGKCGTAWNVWSPAAKKYNLKFEDIDKDFKKAAEILKKGGLVVGSFGNGDSPTYFTSGGHLMVIRKVDETGKFYIADPIQKDPNAEKNTEGYTTKFLLSRNGKSGGALNHMWGFSLEN